MQRTQRTTKVDMSIHRGIIFGGLCENAMFGPCYLTNATEGDGRSCRVGKEEEVDKCGGVPGPLTIPLLLIPVFQSWLEVVAQSSANTCSRSLE